MLVHFRTRIRPFTRLSSANIPTPNCLHQHKPKTLKMALTETQTQSESKSKSKSESKRPVCPSCTKPASLCICSRIQTLALENKVSVSILQHKLEIRHALNSVRIAKLGLKNVTLATVCDVNYAAEFVIKFFEMGPDNGMKSCGFDHVLALNDVDGFNLRREKIGTFGFMKNSSLIDANGDRNGLEGSDFDEVLDIEKTQKPVTEDVDGLNFGRQKMSQVEFVSSLGDDYRSMQNTKDNLEFDPENIVTSVDGKPAISVTIGKYGLNSDFDQILGSKVAVEALARGFVVEKFQKQQSNESNELGELREFELEVPAGSVLLFPSDKSVRVEDLKAMNFNVKNLIVLDGTWAKANRMYKENPWLKLLPHLRLDLEKMSLYSEVRQQPKPGCLSTIESIVYALKAVGDNPGNGLDNLLDVFESMVGDQRRCKDERLRKQLSPG